jgi:predicted transposase YbfD/YdcC
LTALPLVSAWAWQTGRALGQVAVDAKSNEITAMPQLLQLPDLRQELVTTDAMGCQKGIAQTIVAQEGDYILAAKDNQPNLFAEMQAAFTAAEVRPTSTHREYTTEDQDHGRHDYRTVHVLPATKYLSESVLSAWTGLLTLVMLTRVVTRRATGATTAVAVRRTITPSAPARRRAATRCGSRVPR